MSHELTTRLATMKGFASTLRDRANKQTIRSLRISLAVKLSVCCDLFTTSLTSPGSTRSATYRWAGSGSPE